MADVALELRWTGEGLHFEGGVPGGAQAALDGDGARALTPVQTLLAALAGCMAADVIEMLTKMRVRPTQLDIWAEGDRAAEPPRRYLRVRLVYEVGGLKEADRDKVRRAVDLSREKYCSVLHTWRSDVKLDTEIVLR